jgi:hypothetical protein
VTAFAEVENNVSRPVQVIPSGDVAIVFVPEPVATHKDNDEFHEIPFAEVENGDVLTIHVIPSSDVAILFVP